MDKVYTKILNPLGEKDMHQKKESVLSKGKRRGSKLVIGLLNNSKPNVSFFLEALEREIALHAKKYRTINFAKPRSAAPSLDIDAVAQRCDLVINAVAD